MVLLEYKAIFKKHGIIEQVRRYPANEKWIAFSIDAYNFFNEMNDFELKFQAKRYGIGILIVSNGKRVNEVLLPKVGKLKGRVDYLKHYYISTKIRSSID